MLSKSQQILIREACEALSIAYARAIDFRDYEAFVELFTDDAVLEVGRELNGKEAIRESVLQRPDELRTRHVLTNIFIHPRNESTASGVSYLTLYRHFGPESRSRQPAPLVGPAAIGHYEDRFIKREGVWYFKSRILHLAFRDESQF